MSTKVGGNNNTKIEYTYDTNRHPHTMSDPSLGMRTYSYNAFGELISETNNKGQTTNYSYDALGRMTSRTDEDGTTTWQYDQQMAGLLDCTVYEPTDSGEPSVRETFEYDQHGRLIHQNQLLSRENRPLEFTYEYNKYGQRKSITYPSGYALSYSYDPSGNMLSVKNSADGSVLWSASSTDKFGNITNFTLGSNINVGRTYDSQTGLVASLNANSGMLLVQSMQYQWKDNKGNLTSRTDNTTNHQENFTYDNYNRLTNIEIDGNNSRNITYDNLGNVSGKYDAGSMIYNSGNPYAVKKIYDIPNICSYDGEQDITYTSFDKVKSISQGTKTLNVSYGADRQRVRQTLNTGNNTKTKRYFTSLYEVVTNGGTTKKFHYLTSSTGLFAIFAPFGRIVRNTMTKKSLWKYHYTIADHLGNARVEFVPHNGGQPEVVQSVSYYPFGYTLHCNDYGSRQPNRHLFGGKELQDQTLAGITFGWYDFAARMYDPTIGRFMQTDPMAENNAWLTPYHYCSNNPVRKIDPTGMLDDWFENEETGEIYYNVNMHQGDEGTGAMKGSGWKWLGPNGMFGEGLFNSDMSLVARNNGIIDIDADGNFNMEMMLREEKAKALMASVGYKQVNKQEIVYSSTYTQSISDGRHSFRFTYGTSATYSEKVCYVPNGFDEISRVQLGKTLYGNINQATGAFPEVSRYSISYGNLSFWRKVGKAMKIGTGIHDYVNYYDGGSVKSYYESGALNSLINDFLRKYPK